MEGSPKSHYFRFHRETKKKKKKKKKKNEYWKRTAQNMKRLRLGRQKQNLKKVDKKLEIF